MKWLTTLLIAAALLPGAPASAQIRLSVMGGINRATMDLDTEAPIAEPRSGMSIGLTAAIPASDRFGIQLGGIYSQKGTSLDVLGMLNMLEDIASLMGAEGMDVTTSLTDLDLGSNIEMNYIDLTMLARLEFPRPGNVSVHLLAGPALSLRSSCQVAMWVRHGAASTEDTRACSVLDLDVKDFDFGLAGGGGIEIGLTDNIDARLGLLYTLGVFDVSEGDSETVRNRVLNVQTGLSIPIG